MQTVIFNGLRVFLAISFFCGSIAYGQEPAQPAIDHFMQRMLGEWIGIFNQSTDEVQASPKYFHAVASQTRPDTYETVFRYFEVDPVTGNLVDAGTTIMETTISTGGIATNRISGAGEVLIDVDTLKWEQHVFSEMLEMSSPDVLLGTGKGTITVSDSPAEEEGKDGKIIEYASTWFMKDGVLRITQEFEVKFKMLFFGKTYRITMDHEVRRGGNIMDLFSDAASGEGSTPAGQ